MTGVIVKAIAGFYYVRTEDGVLECKARGVFKKRGVTPLVGDDAQVQAGPDGSYTVVQIGPRRNSFLRPPVANVEVMLIVCAAAQPAFDFALADKLCVAAQHAGAEPWLCITKPDLAPDGLLEEIANTYQPLYPLFVVNGRTGEGADALRTALNGRRTALTGPSGAGKSTLTNLLLGGDFSASGAVSGRLRRGRNTTRHSELFFAGSLALFDTPGFTSFDAPGFPAEELDGFFPEFAPYLGSCRFDDCRHLAEPGCAVQKALADGRISPRRYGSYKSLFTFLKEQQRY